MNQLHNIIEQNKFPNVVSWDDSGNSFIIHNKQQFIKNILYNISEFQSFASFSRKSSILGFEKEQYNTKYKFTHPYFKRGHPELLSKLKKKQIDENYLFALNEIKKIQNSVDEIKKNMLFLSNQNELLEQTIKYNSHQTIINTGKILAIVDLIDLVSENEQTKPKKKQKTKHTTPSSNFFQTPNFTQTFSSLTPIINSTPTLTQTPNCENILDTSWLDILN